MTVILTAAMLLLSSLAVAAKLYVFDCGAINLADVTMYGLKPDETKRRPEADRAKIKALLVIR